MSDLVVNPLPCRAQYAANGSQSSFTFPFPLLDAADLEIWWDMAPCPVAFSLTGLGDSAGGQISFALPPPAGTRITLLRRMPIKRETDFTEGGEFRARALNEELDRLTLLVQQADERATRGLGTAPADAPASLTLPPLAERAGKFLGFDATGAPKAVLLDPSGVEAALEATGANAAAAAESAAAAATSAARVEAYQGHFRPFAFDGDGVASNFGLPMTPSGPDGLFVFVGGLFQRPPAWQLVGSMLVFSSAPPIGLRMVTGLIGGVGIALEAEARFQALAWSARLAERALQPSRLGIGPDQLMPNWASVKS